ncbi:hypothetical protein [Dermacoccus barathri]|uniref:hypothetical protein n=1 Tax=Dermacoccus barathri TaxID=322601 RepID=UPI00187A6E28|nr:hypothetical protein [Dermacoccus barathri]MBE7371416.1 hypothetical protein [Dermacoccus barathri]
MTSKPLYALLLDVDGPVASPVTRTIAIASIADDLVTMARAGIPLVFNTGRSDVFVARTVMPALVSAGLPDDAVVLAVCEKGSTWFVPKAEHAEGAGDDLEVDERLRVPTGLAEFCRSIAPDFEDSMFFDATKKAMVSFEANQGIDLDLYARRQREIEQRIWDFLAQQEIGVAWEDRTALNNSDGVALRIDPTIISTDVEHIGTGKQVGADKAVAYLAGLDITPREWRTLGDSRSDYAMADRLHERGFVVHHGDVRPADGLLERTYPVEVTPDPALTNDAAGAAFLTRWRADVKRGEVSAAF